VRETATSSASMQASAGSSWTGCWNAGRWMWRKNTPSTTTTSLSPPRSTIPSTRTRRPSGTSPASPRWTGFRSTSRGATATPTSSSGRPTRCDAPSRRRSRGACASAGPGWIAAHTPRRLSTSPAATATSSTSGP